MIVGRKIVITRGAFSGRLGSRERTAEAKKQEFELHATKGWRLLRTTHGTTTDRRMPAYQAIFLRATPAKPRKFAELSPEAMERVRLRHVPRKKQFWDAVRAGEAAQ